VAKLLLNDDSAGKPEGIHNDDDKREYAYGPKSKIGTFSDVLMAQAKKKSWSVISMKNDWKRIFAFEK